MEFTTQHFIALAPMLITTITTVVVMLAIAWKRNHSQTFLLSTVGLNLALLSILPALKVAPLAVTSLITIDKFACLYMAIMLVATLACVTLAHAYLGEGAKGFPGNREELFLLLLL
ncbi:MAG: NADH-quinone oxidoreductase subunit N, partial [Pseudomonas sp.]|nr:NADH-quinone oxidoreductase subunit N [Pseudomonas sp.]